LAVTLQYFIEDALELLWGGMHGAIEDLTVEQLRWRATPKVNSIGFLIWHITRIEDNFVQRFTQGQPEVWESSGWQQKFGYKTRGVGTGFSDEETAAVIIPPAEVLLGYLDDVNQQTREYLKRLDWSDLTLKPRGDRFPQWSLHTILRQLITHSNRHLGEAEYIRGLQGISGH